MDENKSLADANSGADQDKKAQESSQIDTAGTASSSIKPQQPAASEEKTRDKNQNGHIEGKQKHKRRFHLYHIKNTVKKAHPLHIKAKLEHYRFEYSRILHLARKPTRQEFKELAIMVIIGTSIIGLIGFVIQMIIQFI